MDMNVEAPHAALAQRRSTGGGVTSVEYETQYLCSHGGGAAQGKESSGCTGLGRSRQRDEKRKRASRKGKCALRPDEVAVLVVCSAYK